MNNRDPIICKSPPILVYLLGFLPAPCSRPQSRSSFNLSSPSTSAPLRSPSFPTKDRSRSLGRQPRIRDERTATAQFTRPLRVRDGARLVLPAGRALLPDAAGHEGPCRPGAAQAHRRRLDWQRRGTPRARTAAELWPRLVAELRASNLRANIDDLKVLHKDDNLRY
jgi:hypothetical protein